VIIISVNSVITEWISVSHAVVRKIHRCAELQSETVSHRPCTCKSAALDCIETQWWPLCFIGDTQFAFWWLAGLQEKSSIIKIMPTHALQSSLLGSHMSILTGDTAVSQSDYF